MDRKKFIVELHKYCPPDFKDEEAAYISFQIENFGGYVHVDNPPHVEVYADCQASNNLFVNFHNMQREISKNCWTKCFYEFCDLMETAVYKEFVNSEKKNELLNKLIDDKKNCINPSTNHLLRFHMENVLSYKMSLFVDTYFATIELSKQNQALPLFAFDVHTTEKETINLIKEPYKNDERVQKLVQAFVKAYTASK